MANITQKINIEHHKLKQPTPPQQKTNKHTTITKKPMTPKQMIKLLKKMGFTKSAKMEAIRNFEMIKDTKSLFHYTKKPSERALKTLF